MKQRKRLAAKGENEREKSHEFETQFNSQTGEGLRFYAMRKSKLARKII